MFDGDGGPGIVSIILAAGEGKRMKSTLPKVLHDVGGVPMVRRVIWAAEGAGISDHIVVVGRGREKVEKCLKGENVRLVVQSKRLGTGHAVLQALPLVDENTEVVLILCGDTPLLSSATISRLIETHMDSGVAATVLTAMLEDPSGYGRVIRDGNGLVVRIVEDRDAGAEERVVREVNSGMMCFNARWLRPALERLKPDNVQKELYLTDTVAILRAMGCQITASLAEDHHEILGVNSQDELERIRRICETIEQ